MKQIEGLLALARTRAGGTIAVAAAHDADVLAAVTAAKDAGIADAVLVGDGDKITALLTGMGANAAEYAIVHTEGDDGAALAAVKEVREGRAGFLMKGLLPTATLMRAVVAKESGLRTGRLLSHIMAYEVPGHSRLLFLTDGGLNTYPDLEKKAGILENAGRTLMTLGYHGIHAACICGAEAVDPKIPATQDAAALAAMEERWAPYRMNVMGPVGLDLAISREACSHKGYTHPAGGEADILLVPAYEVGNGIGKALTYFAGARSAGIIVGAKIPIVLVSRADTSETKLASIAFGAAVRDMWA